MSSTVAVDSHEEPGSTTPAGPNGDVDMTDQTTEEMEGEEDYPPNPNDIALVKNAADGRLEDVKRLLNTTDADPCYQDHETGMSVLMAASGAGYETVVRLLLDEGAPWNAVDRAYLCAGDYAARNGHQTVVDAIMDHAVVAEMLLGTVIMGERRTLNTDYLASEVAYTPEGDKLLDDAGLAVMMDWEKPLMEGHAAYICGDKPATARVLNVGFGMGIVDTALQALGPLEHTIIEAHPQVLTRMENEGWDKKPGVRIVRGRWQDVIESLGPFDGVFYDTYAEEDLDLKEFHLHLPRLVVPGGRYSFYNGMCPDNVFFHGVACEVVKLQLKRLGFDCEYEPVKVDVADAKLWQGVTKRYWHFDTYYLPKCRFFGVSSVAATNQSSSTESCSSQSEDRC